VGRRKLAVGAWQVIRFTDHVISGSDSHDVEAFFRLSQQ